MINSLTLICPSKHHIFICCFDTTVLSAELILDALAGMAIKGGLPDKCPVCGEKGKKVEQWSTGFQDLAATFAFFDPTKPKPEDSIGVMVLFDSEGNPTQHGSLSAKFIPLP